MVLEQGRQGVPIGGHISAQLAEIWAKARKLEGLFGRYRGEVASRWKEKMQEYTLRWKEIPPQGWKVGLELYDPHEIVYPIQHRTTMVRHGKVLANRDRGLIHRGTLPSQGFGGWWSPRDV